LTRIKNNSTKKPLKFVLSGFFILNKKYQKQFETPLRANFSPLRGNKKTLRRFDEESFLFQIFSQIVYQNFYCTAKSFKKFPTA